MNAIVNSRFWRWLALVAVICAAVAVLVLPFPRSRVREIRSASDARLSTEMDRLRGVSGALSEAVGGYRRAQAIARWQKIGAPAMQPVTIDPSVPADQRQLFDSLARMAWKNIGLTPSPYADIFVFYDTVAVPGITPKRAEPGRGAEVTYALPGAADGTRCVAMVRLRRHDVAVSPTDILGPCAFYGAFGAPGSGIRHWLVRTRFLAARHAQWTDVSAELPPQRESWYDMDNASAACLARGGRPCLQTANVVASSASSWRLANFTDDTLATSGGPYAMGGGTMPDLRVLSDMVREFGPERFRAFWTSSDGPEQAFERAMGVSLIDWTRQRLERSAIAPSRVAVITWDSYLWLALVLPFLIALSARRRETVVVGRVSSGT